jgi:hypothetical protein
MKYARGTGERGLAKKKKQGIVDPTRLPSFDKGKTLQVIIETPKGSRNKYAWDPDQQIFELKKVLPEGMAFPHDGWHFRMTSVSYLQRKPKTEIRLTFWS